MATPPHPFLTPPPSNRRGSWVALVCVGLAVGVVVALWLPTFSRGPWRGEPTQGLGDIPDRFVDIVLPPERTATVARGTHSPPTKEVVETEAQRTEAQQTEAVQAAKDKSKLLMGLIGTRGERHSGGGGDAFLQDGNYQTLRGDGHSGAEIGASRLEAALSAAPPTKPVAHGDGPRPGTERFTDHGVNPMTLTTKDTQSTFSIDVDTASYALARSSLTRRQLPLAASVRVEEFVNALDYSYVGPQNGAPFAVNMEAAPNPFRQGHHVLRVGVQGARVDPDTRPPVRLTFLVDVSGSMAKNGRLDLARKTLATLVEQLGPKDSVALVTYAGTTRLVLTPTSARRKATILAAIANLKSGGNTAMGAGIDLAYQAAEYGFVKGAENRVIILSDGDANVGQTNHDELVADIRDHARRGITLSTVGFGRGNYNDALMEQLADQGDGNYSYIDSLEEGQRVFGEKFAGTIRTIARDVKIQVDFDPEAVIAYRLVGYENRDIHDQDFRNDQVDAGEIGSGHQVTALYDVVLSASVTQGTQANIATVRLRAKPPGPDAPAEEWETTFPSRLVKGEVADTSASFRLALGTATFAELLRGSPYTEEVQYAQVATLLGEAQQAGYQGDAHVAELLGLVEQAEGLAAEAQLVAQH